MLGGSMSAVGALTLALLADRVGRRIVALATVAFTVCFAFPFFWLIDSRSAALIWLAMGAWMFANGAFLGILGISLAEMFPVKLRYSGISFAYQVAGIFGGGLVPMIASGLVKWSQGATWPLATYLVIVGCMSWLALYVASARGLAEPNEAPAMLPRG
jgi:MFS transporter, MHS family, shikimate and dehydroshikimate transport protein